MKVFIAVALAVLVFGYTNAVSKQEPDLYIFEDVINKTIEEVKASLPEVFQLDNISFVVPSPLNGTVDVESIQITGIKELLATYIKCNLLGLNLEMIVAVPDVKVAVTKYAANISVQGIPVFGKGNINIDLNTIQVGVSGGVNLTDGIALKDTLVSLNVADTAFDIHGLFDNEFLSQLVSNILTNTVAPFMNDYTAVISEVVSPVIEELINSILKQDSVQEILKETADQYNGNKVL